MLVELDENGGSRVCIKCVNVIRETARANNMPNENPIEGAWSSSIIKKMKDQGFAETPTKV